MERSVMSDVLSIYVPSFFLHIGMSIISPVLPIYARSFGVSYALAAMAISVYALGRLVTDLPVGFAADKVGRRPLLLIGAVVLTVGALLNGLAESFWELLLYRFVQGVGSSMWMTSRTILIADIVRPEERGRVLSYFQAFMLLGSSAGPTIGGFVAAGWGLRAPFYAGAACFVLSLLLVHEPDRRAMSREEGQSDGAWLSLNAAKRVLSNRTFTVACLATFTVFFMRTGIRATMIPLYASSVIGLGEAEIGLAISFATIMNLLVTVPVGHLMDKHGRKVVITSNLLITGVSALSFPFSFDLTTLSLSCLLLGVGTGGAGQAPLALAADVTMDAPRGFAMGLYRFFGDVGFIVGPIIVGAVADTFDLRSPFFTVAVLVFLSAFLVQLLAVETVRRKRQS
ncbi:MAG: MFS transporter [Candidatus Bathyarchaeia archaeon]